MRRRLLLAGCGAAVSLWLPARMARATSPPAVDLPPSGRAALQGRLQRGQWDLGLRGTMRWEIDRQARRYRIALEAWVGLGLTKDFVQISEGRLDAWGLAPERFTDRRLLRDPRITDFRRGPDGAGEVAFPGAAAAVPLVAGTQDRVSVLFQLSALARAAPEALGVGQVHEIVTAGSSRAEPWHFTVQAREAVEWADHAGMALRLTRRPRREGDGTLDVWLAEQAAWLPVRTRLVEPDGDRLEQTLVDLDLARAS